MNSIVMGRLFVICVCAGLLVSCETTTTVYERGQPVLKWTADGTNVAFRTPGGTSLTASTINQSTPTLAKGQAASQMMSAGSGMIASAGLAVAGGIVAAGPATATTKAAMATVPAAVTAASAHVSNASQAAPVTRSIQNSHAAQFSRRGSVTIVPDSVEIEPAPLAGNMNVPDLQRRLKSEGLYHGRIDGIFGRRTKAALRAEQNSTE